MGFLFLSLLKHTQPSSSDTLRTWKDGALTHLGLAWSAHQIGDIAKEDPQGFLLQRACSTGRNLKARELDLPNQVSHFLL